MKKHSKYELASSEVREVMTRPPHFLIAWGNTFIFVVIVACLLLLNTISIPKYVRLSYKVIKNDTEGIVITTDSKFKTSGLQSKPIQFPVASQQDKFYQFNIVSFQNNGADQTLIVAHSDQSQKPSQVKEYGDAKILVDQLT